MVSVLVVSNKKNENDLILQSVMHDSAHKHVTGSAVYVDDIGTPDRCLHCYVGLSSIAHGRILL